MLYQYLSQELARHNVAIKEGNSFRYFPGPSFRLTPAQLPLTFS
jgi:hypothetical protein